MNFEITLDGRLHLTKEAWTMIRTINTAGNKIVWTPDLTVWGVNEKWEFPKDVGRKQIEDCDGITLWKMLQLIELGCPADPLLFTIVKTETGEGHAVLCVATDRGDYILDNRYDDVRSYDDLKKIGYDFMYRSKIGGKLTDNWQKIKN